MIHTLRSALDSSGGGDGVYCAPGASSGGSDRSPDGLVIRDGVARLDLGEDDDPRAVGRDSNVEFEVGAEALSPEAIPEGTDADLKVKLLAEETARQAAEAARDSAEAEIRDLKTRLLAAETATRIAEADKDLAQREVLHLNRNAHDARNALTGLLGNVELADMHATDDVTRNYLTTAIEEGQRVTGLLNRKMNPDGNLELNKEPVELHALIDTVLGDAKRFLNSVRVNFARNDAQLMVNADLTNLHSALLNLVKNAAEALEDTLPGNPDPNIVISLSTVKFDKGHPNEFLNHGNYVKIEMSDNAYGVPTKLRKLIFEKGATTKGNKGNGLGLPMVRKIVEAHHGAILLDAVTAEEIEVDESLRGRTPGSKFKIYLPLPSSP